MTPLAETRNYAELSQRYYIHRKSLFLDYYLSSICPLTEKAIVLDLVRAALIEKASFDETRRDIVTSDFKDHSRTSGTQPGGSNEAPCGTMATGDGGWTDQKAGGNGFRQTGRVDR